MARPAIYLCHFTYHNEEWRAIDEESVGEAEGDAALVVELAGGGARPSTSSLVHDKLLHIDVYWRVELRCRKAILANAQDQAVKLFPVYSYLIVYGPETKPLQIVSILHGRCDVEQLLGNRL
jgi:hypothetical protein